MPGRISAVRKQVGRGLAYLSSIQALDGSIAGDSLFANATILQFLSTIPSAKAQTICHRLAAWLAAHKQADGSFGTSLHVTCCILQGLHTTNKALVTSDMLGALARQLVGAEYALGGPYRGVLGEAQPDVATNAVVASLLDALGAPLPNVSEYVAAAQARGAQSALYAAGSVPPGVRDGRDPAVIMGQQQADGSWPAWPYCREANGTWHASEALNTARSLAALAPLALQPSQVQVAAQATDRTYERVVRRVEREMHTLKEPLRGAALHMLQTILAADATHEIALLPFAFADSLKTPVRIPKERLLALGAGNIYNWIAYSIYDDFLDGTGDPKLLSVANVSLRAAVRYFQAGAPDVPDFQKCIAQTFTGIDTANAWEVAYCHMPYTAQAVTLQELPAYGNHAKLAERSYSHALPALGVLANCGIAPHAEPARAVQAAFRHYLIARQLNDDMRDWEDDIRTGQISPVVGAIISALSLGQGQHAFDALLPAMQRQFWQDTLARQCSEVTRHIQLARKAIMQSGLLRDGDVLSRILDDFDAVVAKTYDEQRNVHAFMHGYGTR